MLDVSKPVTFEGKPARIICTDRKCSALGNATHICFLVDDGGSEQVLFCDGNGRTVSGRTLVNVPEKRYLNLYEKGPGVYHKTRAGAEISKNAPNQGSYIKTIEIEI